VTKLVEEPVTLIAVKQPAPGQVESVSVIVPVNALPSLIVTLNAETIVAPDAAVFGIFALRGAIAVGFLAGAMVSENVGAGERHWPPWQGVKVIEWLPSSLLA
jgi:hypothetical protein